MKVEIDESFPDSDYSGWNNRVVKKIVPNGTNTAIQYGIHEVYYDEDGKPSTCTVDPIALLAFDEDAEDPIEILKSELKRYQKALEQPVLNYEDIG